MSKNADFASEVAPRREHSQTRKTRQPKACNLDAFFASLLRFRSSFPSQNAVLVDGNLDRWQPWRCQKHPSTNTTASHWRKTKSGLPGRVATWRRNLRPRANSARRTSSSGFVSLARMLAIIRLRTASETISAIAGASEEKAARLHSRQGVRRRCRLLGQGVLEQVSKLNGLAAAEQQPAAKASSHRPSGDRVSWPWRQPPQPERQQNFQTGGRAVCH